MKEIKHTLFHVSTFESITKILGSSCFKASYCLEELDYSYNYLNRGKLTYQYYIPMVSFNDFSLESLLDGKSTYGNCAVGMKIEWVKSNGLNPVLYLEKHSHISLSIKSIIEEQFNTGQDSLAVTLLMQSIKNFDGSYNNKPICFYEEREWRFIPIITSNRKYPPFIYAVDKNSKDVLGAKPHIIEDEFSLKFKIKDIEYIIVENDEQKRVVCDILEKNGCSNYEQLLIVRCN